MLIKSDQSPRPKIKMSNTLKPYLNCVRASLDAALCLRNFPSQTVERHNKVHIFAGTACFLRSFIFGYSSKK